MYWSGHFSAGLDFNELQTLAKKKNSLRGWIDL
jgi:hypothetical protein